MMLTLSQPVERQVLSLPANERLTLIEKLIMSLNLPIEADIDALQAKEAERRIQELDDGRVEAIPGEEVFTKLRAKFAK